MLNLSLGGDRKKLFSYTVKLANEFDFVLATNLISDCHGARGRYRKFGKYGY